MFYGNNTGAHSPAENGTGCADQVLHRRRAAGDAIRRRRRLHVDRAGAALRRRLQGHDRLRQDPQLQVFRRVRHRF